MEKAELSSSTDRLSCFVFSSLWLLFWSNCVAHFKLFSEGSASHINCAIDSNSTSWNSRIAGKMSFWNYANSTSWKFRYTDSPGLHLLHIIWTSDNCSLMTSLHSFGVKELDQPLEAILQLPMRLCLNQAPKFKPFTTTWSGNLRRWENLDSYSNSRSRSNYN